MEMTFYTSAMSHKQVIREQSVPVNVPDMVDSNVFLSPFSFFLFFKYVNRKDFIHVHELPVPL